MNKNNNCNKDFKYDDIAVFHDVDYTIAIYNGKAGLIDINGNPLIDFIYDDITKDDIFNENINIDNYFHFVNSNYYSLRLNNKWGILNNKGKIIIDFIYDEKIEICSNDLFIVRKNKYGVVNNKQEIVLEFIYDSIYECSQNKDTKTLFIVTLNKKRAVFDSKGGRLC